MFQIMTPYKSLVITFFSFIGYLIFPWTIHAQQALFSINGNQPDFTISSSGKIEVVFGQKNKIFYAYSTDQGQHFSEPSLVDSLVGLHLGASRGPRIAHSQQITIISAIDKMGNVYAYKKSDKNTWIKSRVNDMPEIAKEGFNAIAANDNKQFTIIWLDLRMENKNQLMSSTSKDGGKTWQKNQWVYRSPESHICECCQPNIIIQKQHIAIMFRNWLQGSRDMYVIESFDGGKTYQEARKLGFGTWPLNACPMDGGSLSFNLKGKVETVWRRAENLYVSGVSGEEKMIGAGKNASTTVLDSGQWIVWANQGLIWLRAATSESSKSLGPGRFPIIKAINSKQAYIIWENQGKIFGQMI